MPINMLPGHMCLSNRIYYLEIYLPLSTYCYPEHGDEYVVDDEKCICLTFKLYTLYKIVTIPYTCI